MAEESVFLKDPAVVWKTEISRKTQSPVFSLLGVTWELEMQIDAVIPSKEYRFTVSLRRIGNERPSTHFSVMTFIQRTESVKDGLQFQSQGHKQTIIDDVTTLVTYHIGTTSCQKFPIFKILTKVTVVCVFTDMPSTAIGIPNETVEVTTQTDFVDRILPLKTLHDDKLSSDESEQGASCVSSNLDSLSRDLSKLLEEEVLPDITLRCGDRRVAAHKAVLAARSKVFSAMFQSKMSESETGVVDIADIDGDVLELFLKYLYTGKLFESSHEVLLSLYAAGEKYAVIALTMACSEHLINNLTRENCFRFLLMADAHSNREFKKAIFSFILNNMEIIASDEWEIFCEENLALSHEVLQMIVKQKYLK